MVGPQDHFGNQPIFGPPDHPELACRQALRTRRNAYEKSFPFYREALSILRQAVRPLLAGTGPASAGRPYPDCYHLTAEAPIFRSEGVIDTPPPRMRRAVSDRDDEEAVASKKGSAPV